MWPGWALRLLPPWGRDFQRSRALLAVMLAVAVTGEEYGTAREPRPGAVPPREAGRLHRPAPPARHPGTGHGRDLPARPRPRPARRPGHRLRPPATARQPLPGPARCRKLAQPARPPAGAARPPRPARRPGARAVRPAPPDRAAHRHPPPLPPRAAATAPGTRPGLRRIRFHHARAAGPPPAPGSQRVGPSQAGISEPVTWEPPFGWAPGIPRPGPGPRRRKRRTAHPQAPRRSPDNPTSSTQPASSAPRPPASPGRSASSKTSPAPPAAHRTRRAAHAHRPRPSPRPRRPPRPGVTRAVPEEQQRQSRNGARCPAELGPRSRPSAPAWSIRPLTCADPGSPASPAFANYLRFLHRRGPSRRLARVPQTTRYIRALTCAAPARYIAGTSEVHARYKACGKGPRLRPQRPGNIFPAIFPW